MRYLIIICTLLFITSCKSQNTELTTKIDIATVQEKVIGKEVQLVDVRTADEYSKGFIDDAVNIDFKNLENFKLEVSKLDKEKPIYIYCHSGGRSNRASNVLEELGFKTIYDFSGGWNAWSKQ